MYRARRTCALILTSACATPLLADELFFKNGDHLTGEVVRLEGGTMVFKTRHVGEIKANLSDLESVKTDKPVDVRLTDGTQARATVSDAKEGEVTIGQGTPAARTVPTKDLAAINPKEGWS